MEQAITAVFAYLLLFSMKNKIEMAKKKSMNFCICSAVHFAGGNQRFIVKKYNLFSQLGMLNNRMKIDSIRDIKEE